MDAIDGNGPFTDVGAGGEDVAIVGERGLKDARPLWQIEQFLAGRGAPQFDGLIVAGAGQRLSIRRKANPIDKLRVAAQLESQLLRAHIQHAELIVRAGPYREE